MIHIKSKKGSFLQRKFAILTSPDESVRSDEELYNAVRNQGRAVIVPFNDDMVTMGDPVTLTPSEFESEWQGD